ncbi:MAG: hypothetical protein KME16_22615 [Scytolyngbya sp. HA4215-MV1]|nr:hypothetical protein [Scytolyngbya sp. HA4215-MV1]
MSYQQIAVCKSPVAVRLWLGDQCDRPIHHFLLFTQHRQQIIHRQTLGDVC